MMDQRLRGVVKAVERIPPIRGDDIRDNAERSSPIGLPVQHGEHLPAEPIE
jgi:hypothetical protein